jgi:hypothetical protein
MQIWIVQFRRSGDDYNARLFRSNQDAKRFAFEFLSQNVWNPQDFSNLEDLESHCFGEDIAYIEISSEIV